MIKAKQRRNTVGYVIKNSDSLNDLLQRIAEKQGNISALCRDAGISRKTFYHISNTDRIISKRIICKLCNALSINRKDFFNPKSELK